MLALRVDGGRWRQHLRQVAEANPGIVPVAKGNGYGLGVGRLARKAEWLGVDTMAVGVYEELPAVLTRFSGDVVVLNPWRGFHQAAVEALEAKESRRIIHTVGRLEDLSLLASVDEEGAPRPSRTTDARPRVLLEVMTSMRRHGFAASDLGRALDVVGVRVEGITIHLPLPGSKNAAEAADIVEKIRPDLDRHRVSTIWVSHLDAGQIATLAAANPGLTIRPRIGTALWLGDADALQVTATVLDAHEVQSGQVFGYRRRRTPRAGTLLIVSGGTAHGIGLESPTGELSPRARAATIARGGLDAMGRVRSPYLIGGVQPFFAEPPHMQSSMLFVPRGTPVPEVGDEISARVRHTATTFDVVEVS